MSERVEAAAWEVVVAGYDLAHWCQGQCERHEWLVCAILVAVAVLA